MKYSRYEKLGEAGNSEIIASKTLLKETEPAINFDNLGKLMEEELKLDGYRIQWYDASFWGTGSPEQLDVFRQGYRKPFTNTLHVAGRSSGHDLPSPMKRLIAVGLGVREKASLPFATKNWGTEIAAASAASLVVGAEVAYAGGVPETVGVLGLVATGTIKALPYTYNYRHYQPHNRFPQEFQELVQSHNNDVTFNVQANSF